MEKIENPLDTEINKNVINCFEKNLPKLIEIITNEKYYEENINTAGFNQKPFGKDRLKILEILGNCLKSNAISGVTNILLDCKIFSIFLVKLFIKFVYNYKEII